MDSNVSKNTFSHNFFKVRLTQEQAVISLRSLLAERLLQTLNLYQQRWNLPLDSRFFPTIIDANGILSCSVGQILPLKNQGNQILFKPSITAIVYSSPISFTLTRYSSLFSITIAKNLLELLTLNHDHNTIEPNLKLGIEIAADGWLNFYLTPQALSTWLQQLMIGLNTYAIQASVSNVNLIDATDQSISNAAKKANILPIQYAHARCCSLLRLGEQAKLIAFKKDSNDHTWQIQDPLSISWLDQQQNFCLEGASEYYLLQQLSIVIDAFANANKSDNWVKLGMNLSVASEIFQAECRFLGEVAITTPNIAIARLGLIALVRYWLEKILQEKLKVIAPRSL
ncbi:DALR anticodon binding domain protein [Chondrocystis sp. NIES-4102]|nr:DALR anticodon binding domain protein [Chondrocystis sp. NIES-4102]